MPTILMAFVTNLLTIFPGGTASLWAPPPIEIVVKRGQSAVIYNVRAYKTHPTCMTVLPVPVDVYPATRLGAVSTSPSSMKGDGPCGVGSYPLQRVTYTAGATRGVEQFEVYFYLPDGKRDQRTVNITVR
jgi:hypothetical protein